MDHLRRYALLVFLLVGTLGCSLTAAPATPTATVEALPTVASSDTPPFTATVEASDTPPPSETPDAFLQSLPAPFANLNGVSQYFNPVGQPAESWNGLPIMPQATAGQEFKPGAVYGFKAPATIAQGVSFYQGKLPALGFSLNGGLATGSGGSGAQAEHDSFLEYFKGAQILIIYIASYDSDPGTIMVVISRE
jgi:hypothetical protein